MVLTNIAVACGITGGALGLLASQTNPEVLANPFMQYGALGILAFMIWTQSRERKGLIDAMREQWTATRAKDAELLTATTNLTNAANRMSDIANRCAGTRKE